jgi:hypothetical protein
MLKRPRIEEPAEELEPPRGSGERRTGAGLPAARLDAEEQLEEERRRRRV